MRCMMLLVVVLGLGSIALARIYLQSRPGFSYLLFKPTGFSGTLAA